MKTTGLIFLFLLFFCDSVFAGYRYNSNTRTRDYCSSIISEDGTVSSNKCEDVHVSGDGFTDEGSYFLLTTSKLTYGYTSMTTQQIAVSTSYTMVFKAISADPAFSTGTLADGKRGQLLTIKITAVNGNGTWTLTPTHKTGFTSLVFEAVGDLITLLYVDDVTGWIQITKESVQSI